jgi:ubiquinone biosynthesis protein UbiJ
MLIELPLAAALNRLLGSEPWARERLAPFAGESVELRAAPLPPLRFIVREDGGIDAATPDAAPALTVTFGAGALAAALRGEEHLLRAVEVSGNARLASEVMFLVRHLRWDAEEDAARVIGDIAAHRLFGMLRGAAAWHAEAARRVAESVVEYATEEARILVPRAELADVADETARLRDALDRLEKRIDRMVRAVG